MDVEVCRAAEVLIWRDGCFWHLKGGGEPEPDTTGDVVDRFARAIREFSLGRKAPLLVDRPSLGRPTFSALTHFSKAAPELFSAIAYYAASDESASVADAIRRTFLDSLPVEIFSDEGDAILWLKTKLQLADLETRK